MNCLDRRGRGPHVSFSPSALRLHFYLEAVTRGEFQAVLPGGGNEHRMCRPGHGGGELTGRGKGMVCTENDTDPPTLKYVSLCPLFLLLMRIKVLCSAGGLVASVHSA